ncbi:MAG: lysylphosphatidylglycerol synthase transmembrane domain-containing protein [Bacteroidota bacterium]|nr:lysylphosphatidylglycerol synthase transmembrane domain-containing protein [Bacteroidota bacterium]
MKLNKNTKLFINYFLGPLLFAWLAWSIYHQIKKQPDLETAWRGIKESFSTPLVWNLVAVILLMIVNWSVEAIKWKISVKPIQQVSFLKALRAVLSGVSFSVSTPNRVGEYLGRVLYMDEGNRLKTISITIVGSISQLIITLLMGCIGLIILRPGIESNQVLSPIWMKVIIYGTIAVLSGLLLFYFRLAWIIKWVDRLPGSNRFAYLIRALEDFDTGLLFKLLLLSAMRFVVFIVQYYLLFHLFAVDVSWSQVFWAVSVSFLVMAVIPTIAIVELVQRGKVMTTIMALYTTNNLGVGFTTAGIWLINLIIPAIIGSLLLLVMRKIYSKKEE